MSKPLTHIPNNQRTRTVPENTFVKYKHIVLAQDINGVLEKRNTTVCNVIDRDTREIVAQGYSICSPNDTYRRKVGNHIALQRALKSMQRRLEREAH